jgi:hypothetical protein
VIAQQPATTEPETLPTALEPDKPTGRELEPRAVLKLAGSLVLNGLRILGLGVLVVLVAAGIVGGGLNLALTIGAQTAEAAGPPRPNPVLPPAVPIGARPDWAEWSYVQKINEVWGKDWPKVIEWFEEFNARYPGNPMVQDKLYAAYIEDGRRLMHVGDEAAARRRFEQAARFDPKRSEAADFLAELDERQSGR